MSEVPERLSRLLESQLGECCDGDVERRLAELRSLEGTLPNETDSDRAALQTLGDETRHRLARVVDAADRELCVCEIRPLFDVTESAISHALGDLHDAGLLSRRKEGTWHYYDTTERAEELLSALDATRGTHA